MQSHAQADLQLTFKCFMERERQLKPVRTDPAIVTDNMKTSSLGLQVKISESTFMLPVKRCWFEANDQLAL